MKAQMYNASFWVDETYPTTLIDQYTKILNRCGFGVLKIIEHHFEPHGYTALFLLSESHLAIHTFPEHRQSYIELTSCVKLPYYKFLDALKPLNETDNYGHHKKSADRSP